MVFYAPARHSRQADALKRLSASAYQRQKIAKAGKDSQSPSLGPVVGPKIPIDFCQESAPGGLYPLESMGVEGLVVCSQTRR